MTTDINTSKKHLCQHIVGVDSFVKQQPVLVDSLYKSKQTVPAKA